MAIVRAQAIGWTSQPDCGRDGIDEQEAGSPALSQLFCPRHGTNNLSYLVKAGSGAPSPALLAAQLINSLYDLDAHYGKKRTTLWVGYKVHFSETCDEDAPS